MQTPFSRTFFELLREQAERYPDGIAVIAQGEAVSFEELATRAGRVAAQLYARGARRGARVGLLVDNRAEWLEIFFGVVALGAVAVPFSTWSTRPELEYLFRESKVGTLFTLGRYKERDFLEDVRALACSGGQGIEQIIVVGENDTSHGLGYREFLDEDLPGNAATIEPAAWPPGVGASAADPLTLLHTSGSSSRPKSVPLNHYATIENAFNIGERQGLKPTDKVFVPVPLFWSYGAINALPAALSHGATLVLQDRFEPTEALALIERYGCTAIYTLPAITNALLAVPSFDSARTRSLRTGVTIGSPQDVIRAANELGATEICNIYGSTETYGNCCVTWHHWSLERRAHCQGEPLPGVTLRVRDPGTGEFAASGEIGALEVKGYLTTGYAGASAKHNGEVFTDDGFFRTGDLALLKEDGTVRYAGRSSEMIKRSGINVSPAEIEEVLQQHEDVGLAGVTGTPDEVYGERIVAFIVSRPGSSPTKDSLVVHCRAQLSSYKLPDEIRFRDDLPLTATGKLMRKELAALATRREIEG